MKRTIVLLAILSTACILRPPSQPDPRYDKTGRVRDAVTNELMPGVVVTIGDQVRTTDAQGGTNPRFVGLEGQPQACAEKDDYKQACVTVEREGEEFLIRLTPAGPQTPTHEPTTRLEAKGGEFRRPDGTVFKWHGITAFTALSDWLAGNKTKLEKYADETQARGVNTWRVFAIWVNTNLTPIGNDRYYAGVRELLTWARSRGLYVQLTALCDQVPGSSVLMTPAQRDAHVRELVAISRDVGNVFFEVSNEDWQNGDVADDWPPSVFEGVLAARSAVRDDQYPDAAGSILQWTAHHTPRDQQWPRKAKELLDVARLGFGGGAPPFDRVWDPTRKPASATEPIRIAEGTSPRQHADYFAVAELYGIGGNIHGGFSTIDPSHQTDLQNCVFPTNPDHVAFIDQVGVVWRAGIPATAAATGRYTRGGLNDVPVHHEDRFTDAGENLRGALRTFCMIEGDKATCVVVDPGRDHPGPVAINGWRIVRTVIGVVFLER